MNGGAVGKLMKEAEKLAKEFEVKCNIWIQENLGDIAESLLSKEEILEIKKYREIEKLESVWGEAINAAFEKLEDGNE